MLRRVSLIMKPRGSQRRITRLPMTIQSEKVAQPSRVQVVPCSLRLQNTQAVPHRLQRINHLIVKCMKWKNDKKSLKRKSLKGSRRFRAMPRRYTCISKRYSRPQIRGMKIFRSLKMSLFSRSRTVMTWFSLQTIIAHSIILMNS